MINLEHTLLLKTGLDNKIYRFNYDKKAWIKDCFTEKQQEISDQIKKNYTQYSNIIIIPDSLPNKIKENKLPLLCSIGFKKLIQIATDISEELIWEVNESISPEGTIVSELSEPEINKALRYIFSTKSRLVLFALTNAIFNPAHEKSISNVLHTARIKAISVALESLSDSK